MVPFRSQMRFAAAICVSENVYIPLHVEQKHVSGRCRKVVLEGANIKISWHVERFHFCQGSPQKQTKRNPWATHLGPKA